MGLSIIPFVPFIIFFAAYFAHLKSIGAIASDQMQIFYILSTVMLLLAAGFGTYEVLTAFKAKTPILLHAKRFLSRATLVFAYGFSFYGFWNLLMLFMSPVLKMEYTLTLSLLAVSVAFAILMKNKRSGRFIKKLTMEG